MSIKDERTASLLVHLAGNYIAREAGRETLITPTRAELGNDRNAVIYVSVFPDEHMDHALLFLSRHTEQFRAYLKKESRFSFLPRVTFAADLGEKHRQHLDDISRGL
ncbi:MAG: hypothetical protein WBK28_01095 [Minisyncoccia bacterium]